MGFTRAELERFRDATVPDLIGANCRLLFVGINPGLWTAATQTHFCHPSNRFYPAMKEAGLITFDLDTSVGMTEDQRLEFTSSGIGITNLVRRATVRASELTREELVAGGQRLTRLVAERKPKVVAVAGITAYRTALADKSATLGRQGSSSPEIWVVPNPSGLNAHASTADLAEWFRMVGERASLL